MNRRQFLQLAAMAANLEAGPVDWPRALESRLDMPRINVGLDGDWLFLPDHQVPADMDPRLPASQDRSWPTLDVPNFWRPIEWEINTPDMGASERWVMLEQQRVARYKFDALNTRAGWYRCWIDIPSGLEGKRFTLRFNGIASISKIWWNGKPAGAHVGMFGPFECDVTPYVQLGRPNLLAAFVSSGQYTGTGNPRIVEEIAVTVELTREMFNSLPQAGYEMMGVKGGGGIWQPVELVITPPARIDDVFFKPRLDGGMLEVTLSNHGSRTVRQQVRYRFADHRTGRLLHEDRSGVDVEIAAGAEKTVPIPVGGLQPKLWSPEEPNCYRLTTSLCDGRELVDQVHCIAGFRTFEARGPYLYLNGERYFLRGANTPPYGLNPNSAALAHKFITYMHEGNQFVTRFHHTAPNELWLNACDTIGVGAAIEGEWPYMMSGNSEIPPREIVEIWHRDQIEKFKSVRNHPSVLLWSMNNEWRFHAFPEGELGSELSGKVGYFDRKKERRLEKWEIVSSAIKDVRKIDGTRPIICSSEYTRVREEYENDLKPRGLDDGDIDDIHVYNGIYGPSVFNLDIERDLERRYANPGRPLVSLEPSTGYPNNDTGYWTQQYIDRQFVPQAWVGQYTRDQSNPMLKYHSVITKEYIEKIRRRSKRITGWVLFGNENWFRHPYDPQMIEPYPTYGAAKLALSPILVSLDCMNRHFETGQRVTMPVWLVHDDIGQKAIAQTMLRWAVVDSGGVVVSRGEAEMPSVEYYGRTQREVVFEMPASMPAARNEATLLLKLWSGDAVIAENEYRLLIAKPEWYKVEGAGGVAVLGNGEYLRSMGIENAGSMLGPDTAVAIVMPDAQVDHQKLQPWIEAGGKALFLAVGDSVYGHLLPPTEKISIKYKQSWDKPAEWGAEYVDVALVTPLAHEIVPVDDMRWWNASDSIGPRVADRIFEYPKPGAGYKSLADYIAPHGYLATPADLDKLRGVAVLETTMGKGRLVASTLRLTDDPVARKSVANLVRYLEMLQR